MEGKKNIRIVSFDGETVEFERVECGTISKLALEEKLNSIRLCRNQHHFAKEKADSALAALDEEEAKLKELFAILAQAEAEFAPCVEAMATLNKYARDAAETAGIRSSAFASVVVWFSNSVPAKRFTVPSKKISRILPSAFAVSATKGRCSPNLSSQVGANSPSAVACGMPFLCGTCERMRLRTAIAVAKYAALRRAAARPIESISAGETQPRPMCVPEERISLSSSSRRARDSFLLSRRPSTGFSPNITAPITSGPANTPRPTSSTPTMVLFSFCCISRFRFGFNWFFFGSCGFFSGCLFDFFGFRKLIHAGAVEVPARESGALAAAFA